MTKATLESMEQDYRATYLPAIHKIGTVTMVTLLVFTFAPSLFLSFTGHFPGWSVLGKIFVTNFGLNIYAWFFEPFLFYPLIGATGLYLAGTSGNIINIRFPASLAAQDIVGAEKGTLKAEMASVMGIIGSIITNLALLIFLVIFSSWIVSILPQPFMDATKYVVPSVFGGIYVMILSQLGVHRIFIREEKTADVDERK